jgi:hypothetical protein
MRKKGERGYVEYVQPVNLDERSPDVEVLFSKYSYLKEHNSYSHTEEIISRPLSSVICKVSLKINENMETYEHEESDETVIHDFLGGFQQTSRSRAQDTDKERSNA